MAVVDVVCRFCGTVKDVRRHGKSLNGDQKYCCLTCSRTFRLYYQYESCKAGVKGKIIEMAMNNS